MQITVISDQGSEPSVRQNSPSFEDTTAPHGKTRRPRGQTDPPRQCRLGHTTRFFTMSHQQRTRPPAQGMVPGANSSSCRVLTSASRRDRPVQLTMFAGANIGGGGDRARTDDPLLAKQVLSQLSYTPGGPPLGCDAATAPTGVTITPNGDRGSCTIIGFRSLLRKPLSPRCFPAESSGGGPGRI
jgi:hypothetical protein